jgi:hypothetical protein
MVFTGVKSVEGVRLAGRDGGLGRVHSFDRKRLGFQH